MADFGSSRIACVKAAIARLYSFWSYRVRPRSRILRRRSSARAPGLPSHRRGPRRHLALPRTSSREGGGPRRAGVKLLRVRAAGLTLSGGLRGSRPIARSRSARAVRARLGEEDARTEHVRPDRPGSSWMALSQSASALSKCRPLMRMRAPPGVELGLIRPELDRLIEVGDRAFILGPIGPDPTPHPVGVGMWGIRAISRLK